MKYCIFFLFFLCISLPSFSQKYGNEWIDYTQKYYSFYIANNGVYKLDYTTIRASGIDTKTFSSANIQLMGREREIPIHVVDGGDNKLDSGDYILFHAKRNDGWLDSLLYEKPKDIGNPSYSLVSDGLYYFFTWNSKTNNLRFTPEVAVDYSNYSATNYWISKNSYYDINYYTEAMDVNNLSSTFYLPGEGFCSNYDGVASNISIDLTLFNPSMLYTGADAPDGTMDSKVTSHSSAQYTQKGNHHFQYKWKNSNKVLVDTVFVGHKYVHNELILPIQDLKNDNVLKWSILNDQGALTDNQGINWLGYSYPKKTNLDGLKSGDYWLDNSKTSSKINLTITNTTLKKPIVLTLGTKPVWGTPTMDGLGNCKVLLPNTNDGSQQEIIISDESLIQSITTIAAVNGTGTFIDYDAISSESAIIMIYPSVLKASAAEYAAYRTSPDGGNHNVVFANAEELYMQFGGGIPKHFIAFRRFTYKMYIQSLNKPNALLLLGKGVNNKSLRTQNIGGVGNVQNNSAISILPTYGYPSSDNAFTSKLIGNIAPLLATGRISVNSDAELVNYLSKIKAYEKEQDQNSVYNSASKDWQKHVLHLSGGSTTEEQKNFTNYLSKLENIIEKNVYGGEVMSYTKKSSAPIDPVNLSNINKRIEDGLSLMTFFGHSSASSFSVAIQDPTEWNNKGKYPLVVANGCDAGELFLPNQTLSERYVNAVDRGAIGFLSPGILAYDSYLDKYSSLLYTEISKNNYGDYIGRQIKNTIATMCVTDPNRLNEITSYGFILNGDPMLRVNYHNKPEIEVTNQSIQIFPKEVVLSLDSLSIGVVVKNLGRSFTDTVNVELHRKMPKSKFDSVYSKPLFGLHYLDTVTFKVPLQANISAGVNNFDVSVDIPSFLPEQYDEIENNHTKHQVLLQLDGITPIYPYEFAVVPNDSVVVKASTSNPLAKLRTYRFELDTTDSFLSPFCKSALVTALGGVQEVFPDDWKSKFSNKPEKLICTDSTVYFWRVAVDSTSLLWNESSFQYITGKNGWGQAHFFQGKENSYSGLMFDRSIRERTFDTISKKLEIEIYDNPSNQNMYTLSQYTINNERQEYAGCGVSPALHVAVIDPKTFIPWKTHFQTQNIQNYFGNMNENGACRQRSEAYFIFNQDSPTQMKSFQDMVTNKVPDGHYLIIYSHRFADYQYWNNVSPSIYQTFKDLGSDSLKPGRPNRGFIFFVKKGDKSSVKEVVATQNGELMRIEENIKLYNNSGQESTPTIGPSVKWGTLSWRQQALETNTKDSTVLEIELLDKDLALVKKIDTIMTSQDSIIQLNNLIDAKVYPYIRLTTKYKDLTNFNPAQVKRLHVLYQPVPEAAIDGRKGYTWIPKSDTLDEGLKIKFAIDVMNVSAFNMDSLLINYWVEDNSQQIKPLAYPRKAPLFANKTWRDTITFSTGGMAGNNTLWMEVNPFVVNNQTDQPEQFHFNNLLAKNFYVVSDKTNPILDVTFDNRHILNQDLVRPNVEIEISLKDENDFAIMNSITDTALFQVYVTNPLGIQRRIPFIDKKGTQIIQFIPANAQNKRCRLVFTGDFNMDGKYNLSVQGADRNGNLSGDYAYTINFEVINESSISYLTNYPNPFSSSTRFVYTLTGSSVPENMIIQIMTISGKVVREITEDELGPLQIGRNQITNYAWDGKDQFGDPLANGIYLYRVLARSKGEEIKHRVSEVDSHFKHEFGKMYLMR
jgi:hypothetical protein